MATAIFQVAAKGFPALSFQWYQVNEFDPENPYILDQQTSRILTLLGVTSDMDGNQYFCRVSNSTGTTDSNPATLHVLFSPFITTQPVDTEVGEGESLLLFLVAEGSAPLSYQWYKDSDPISGANSSSYEVLSPTDDDDGEYFCIVSNSVGQVETDTVTVSVETCPAFDDDASQQPVTAGWTIQPPGPLGTIASTGIAYQYDHEGNTLNLQEKSIQRTLDFTATDIAAQVGFYFKAFHASDGSDSSGRVRAATIGQMSGDYSTQFYAGLTMSSQRINFPNITMKVYLTVQRGGTTYYDELLGEIEFIDFDLPLEGSFGGVIRMNRVGDQTLFYWNDNLFYTGELADGFGDFGSDIGATLTRTFFGTDTYQYYVGSMSNIHAEATCIPPLEDIWSRSFGYTGDEAGLLATVIETDEGSFYPFVNKRMILDSGPLAVTFTYEVLFNGGSDGWNLYRGAAIGNYSSFYESDSFNQIMNSQIAAFAGWQTGIFGWTYFAYGPPEAIEAPYTENGVWGNPFHGTTTFTISALKMNGKRDITVHVIGYNASEDVLFDSENTWEDRIDGSDIMVMAAGASDTYFNDGSFEGEFTYFG